MRRAIPFLLVGSMRAQSSTYMGWNGPARIGIRHMRERVRPAPPVMFDKNIGDYAGALRLLEVIDLAGMLGRMAELEADAFANAGRSESAGP
jgi:hypothetical protein